MLGCFLSARKMRPCVTDVCHINAYIGAHRHRKQRQELARGACDVVSTLRPAQDDSIIPLQCCFYKTGFKSFAAEGSTVTLLAPAGFVKISLRDKVKVASM